MEVSSHALELGRADGHPLRGAVFTNLTQDHLDFHPTMEAYFAAKRRLFDGPGPAVVNVDDEYGRRLADELDELGHVRDRRRRAPPTTAARDVRFDVAGARFAVDARRAARVETRLPGPLQRLQRARRLRHRARAGRRPRGRARAALAAAGRVPGRFEPVEEGQGFGVLVDYAHTPDSLDNVLRAARELTEGRLHVVFGAGGDRDRGKRPLMGEAAAARADRVIVTSDNPRSEDPEAIIEEILAGRRAGRRARARPPRGDRAGGRDRRARRRRRDRRQGPRAGPGVRGRPQGAVRRPRGGARGAARAGRSERVNDRTRHGWRRPPAASWSPATRAPGPARR